MAQQREFLRASWNDLKKHLNVLLDVAERAVEECVAALIWPEAFSFLMPLPKLDEVELADVQTSWALMQLPNPARPIYTRLSMKRRR